MQRLELGAHRSPRAAPERLRWRRVPPGAHHVDVKIAGGAGMHARPATDFVDIAGQFESDIRVQRAAKIANGKAMASMLKLGVAGGHDDPDHACGPDAEAALQALKEAVDSGLGDEEEPKEANTRGGRGFPSPAATRLTGVSASPGSRDRSSVSVPDDAHRRQGKHPDPESEKLALKRAIATANEQIRISTTRFKQSGQGPGGDFPSSLALLNDAEMLQEVSTHDRSRPQRRVVLAARH